MPLPLLRRHADTASLRAPIYYFTLRRCATTPMMPGDMRRAYSSASTPAR